VRVKMPCGFSLSVRQAHMATLRVWGTHRNCCGTSSEGFFSFKFILVIQSCILVHVGSEVLLLPLLVGVFSYLWLCMDIFSAVRKRSNYFYHGSFLLVQLMVKCRNSNIEFAILIQRNPWAVEADRVSIAVATRAHGEGQRRTPALVKANCTSNIKKWEPRCLK
jgi:hypothetical protein